MTSFDKQGDHYTSEFHRIPLKNNNYNEMKLEDTLIYIILFLLPVFSIAQNNSANHKIGIEIPEVALLGLVSDAAADININILSPKEAGNSIEISNTQNKNIWINYSSILARKDHKRKIIAMVQGEIPKGIRLKLEASEAVGSGKGETGQPAGIVTLSNEPSDIILDIGSCYTGKGLNNGHHLIYKLEINDSAEEYAQLTPGQTSLNVIYTLTDLN